MCVLKEALNNFSNFYSVAIKYEKLLAFFLASALFMLLHQVTNALTFPYDSGQYWSLAEPSTFFNFPVDIRGYFYPLLLLPAHYIANVGGELSFYVFRIYSSLAYAFALTIVLPSFYITAFGGKITLIRRMVVPLLVAVLFPGVIIYPLSDLPAFILIIASVNFLLNINASEKWSLQAVLRLLFSGFLAYAAYNTRTIYMFPLLFILMCVPFISYKGRLLITKILATAIFITGMALASLPQTVINFNTTNRITPLVISQISDKSLFALQLMWGITIQRYSTNIGPNASPGQYFMDGAGMRLFESEKLTRDNVSIATYLALVANNPMHFIGTYTRHVINGMDLRDGEVYIQNAKKSRTHNILSAINFIVLFCGLWVLYIRRIKLVNVTPKYPADSSREFSVVRTAANRSWGLWLAVLFLPILAIVPGAIETRFFLPFHVLIYCTIAFNCSINELKDHFYSYTRMIFFIFIVLFSLYCAISLSTMASHQDGINLKYKFVK